MADFVHYHRRVVTVARRVSERDLWFARQQAQDAGFAAPLYHRTRAGSGPASKVRTGDTIWLMSQVQARGRESAPLALDARIVVGDVVDARHDATRPFAFQYDAAPGSCWFPLFDPGRILSRLHARGADGAVAPHPLHFSDRIHPGMVLRRMRQIADAAPLREAAAEIGAAPLHFVSYRLGDGTWPAFAHVRALLEEGHAVWWDRWCLPRRLAERREEVSSAGMTEAIDAAIGQAAVFWGIETASYADPDSYAARERRTAEACGTAYRAVRPAVRLS